MDPAGTRLRTHSTVSRKLGRLRPKLVLAHRWVGLVLAGFLILAGLTGALLAWQEELDGCVNPRLLRVAPPTPGAAMLDPLALRQKVQDRYPEAYAAVADLRQVPGHAAIVRLFGRPDPATGMLVEPPNDQVFVNPYTGEVLGERKWGELSQGLKNLVPFIYRLHYSLALGPVGSSLMGILALLWTLDCFVGAWLTLPAPQRRSGPRQTTSGLRRWWPAWTLCLRGGAHKLNVDLHRAGGLWLWAMLLVLAWSSVSFNLHDEVYDPVMRTVLAYQPGPDSLPRPRPLSFTPALDWHAARDTGRRLMAAQSRLHGFEVLNEILMVHDPRYGPRGIYRYQVRSSRDIRDRWGSTQVIFDADTGELLRVWLPTGAASGDTVHTWLTSLHMAALWGWPMQLFVSLTGLAVAMLSITGIYIWRQKRRARRRSAALRLARAPTPPAT